MTCGGWKYAAASVVGTSHRQSGEAICQDSHVCEYIEGSSALVAVLSDGAGSASHSQFGSRSTCDFVMGRAANVTPEVLLSRDFAGEVLEGLRRSLEDRANNEQVQVRACACTMLAAIICDDRAACW